MDTKTYELMTSADVTIDHIFSLLEPKVALYRVRLKIEDVFILTRAIRTVVTSNDTGKVVHGFLDYDGGFLRAIAEKPVTDFWMSEEPFDDDEEIIVPVANITVTI